MRRFCAKPLCQATSRYPNSWKIFDDQTLYTDHLEIRNHATKLDPTISPHRRLRIQTLICLTTIPPKILTAVPGGRHLQTSKDQHSDSSTHVFRAPSRPR